MHRIVMALAASGGLLLLGGCWYGEMRTQMSPEELAQVDDARFCRAMHYTVKSNLAGYSRAFMNEFDRRAARGMDCGLVAEVIGRERASDAAIAGITLGAVGALGAAAAQPARPAAPRVIECSPVAGSLGRGVSCW
jgi:hypothetical protein